MTVMWIASLAGSRGRRRHCKESLARIEALAEPYRTTAMAMNRYLLHRAATTGAETLARMMHDHADLWERAALDGTPVRAIVGDDPGELAETFALAYTGRPWFDKERTRLSKAIAPIIAS